MNNRVEHHLELLQQQRLTFEKMTQDLVVFLQNPYADYSLITDSLMAILRILQSEHIKHPSKEDPERCLFLLKTEKTLIREFSRFIEADIAELHSIRAINQVRIWCQFRDRYLLSVTKYHQILRCMIDGVDAPDMEEIDTPVSPQPESPPSTDILPCTPPITEAQLSDHQIDHLSDRLAAERAYYDDQKYLQDLHHLSSVPVSTPSPEPKPVPLDQVFFSAVAPKLFPKGETTELTVVMYEEEYRSILEEIKDNYGGEVITRRSGAIEIAKHTKIRITMPSEDVGVHFHNAAEEGFWIGKYLEFCFWVDVPRDYDKTQIHFSAHVYVNDVRLTTLRFLAKCVSDSVQQITPRRRDIRTAFVSYAHQDIEEVSLLIQGIKKVRPDLELFMDLENLRSGDHWQEVLKSEMDRRDMLYLCWSTGAMSSEWVNFEWRYMYDRRGIDYIDPIPLESPKECPPPQELEQLHFDDRWLHYRTKKPPHIASPGTTRFYIRDCRNGNIFPINKKIVLIGRAPDTDIRLSSPQVSRCHAIIEAMSDGRFWVQDMNSTRGTFHAETEERITAAGCIVTRGAKIRLASETLEIL